MRTINPLPRQVTIPCVAGVTSSFSEYAFTEDCILHSVVSEVSFAAPAGTSGAFAGGFNAYRSNSSILNLSNAEITPAVHFYRYVPVALSSGQAVFTNTTRFENVLVGAGNRFTVLAERSGLCAITGSFTLSFTPLSEWVNFREPRVAVRL